MAKSLFSQAYSRGVFVSTVLALILGIIFYSQFASRALAQPGGAAMHSAASATAETRSSASPDVFLELAATVGQSAPAKRLIDYRSRFDPAEQQRYWAVVDFNQPSTSKRLYVFDTVEKKVSTYYVAHGRGSGENMAERFSNVSGSNSSSLGIYRALGEYVGHHGRSLRLEGLEPTNSNVLARAVVMHTADYVSEAFIRQTGRLGRSEGCFAVEKAVGNTLIDELKDGAYIIASKN